MCLCVHGLVRIAVGASAWAVSHSSGDRYRRAQFVIHGENHTNVS